MLLFLVAFEETMLLRKLAASPELVTTDACFSLNTSYEVRSIFFFSQWLNSDSASVSFIPFYDIYKCFWRLKVPDVDTAAFLQMQADARAAAGWAFFLKFIFDFCFIFNDSKNFVGLGSGDEGFTFNSFDLVVVDWQTDWLNKWTNDWLNLSIN